MKKPLTFITGNEGKLRLLKKYLDYPIVHKKLDTEEIQSLDLQKVVEHKAKEAYKILQEPVLVEDTSLVLHALGKLPGPLIKWFLEELETSGICRLLDNFADRSALAEVCYGFYDGKDFYAFYGSTDGSIADNPHGSGGIGWDAAFIPINESLTWGEMDGEGKTALSMRQIALKKFAEFLETYE